MTRTTIKSRQLQWAFTLAELLVSTGVLVLLVLLLSQLLNTTATTVRPGNKHIDTDTEARTVFDRMAVDFAQMLKRRDVDYYFKANTTKYPGKSGNNSKKPPWAGGGQTDLNDYIAFYSQAAGYSSSPQSPLSLVAYRINGSPTSPAYNKLERRGETLVWNGVSNFNKNNATQKPIFFLPVLIKDIWPAVADNTANNTKDQPYLETIGPNVFRFEYCYLLKSGVATDTPWNTNSTYGAVYGTFNGLSDVEAIGVTIAVIDPQNRALLVQGDPTEDNLLTVQLYMKDFRTAPGNGLGNNKKSVIDMEAQWNQVITDPINYPLTANMPRAALSAIRIYSRTFDLKTL
jgi:Type II secretory pathway, component PulJ